MVAAMTKMPRLFAVALSCLLVAACGGKSAPPKEPTPPDNTVTPPSDDEGSVSGYGGDGYGDDSEAQTPIAPPPPVPPDIVGTFSNECTVAGKGDFSTMTFTNTADHWDLVIAHFSDAKCTKRTVAVHLAGAYTIGAQSSVPGAWDGDFTIEARDITADDKKTAAAMSKLCGTKLKAKTKVDLQAKGCPGLGIKPAADCANDYDLVSRHGPFLTWGVRPADNDMCTVEKRPTALDPASRVALKMAPLGLPECDDYIGKTYKLMACDKLPPEAADAMWQGITAMEASLREAGATPGSEAAKAAADACKQANEAIAQAGSQLGC
jgi:hypothetical protein